MQRVLSWLRGASGPAVARAFHGALACVSICAWGSLLLQLDTLAGPRGLLPLSNTVSALEQAGQGFFDDPTLFLWFGSSSAALWGLAGAGLFINVLALLGVAPRLWFLLSAVLYLSMCVVLGPFTAFQWDNLLIEISLLAALIPRDGPSVTHFVMRCLFVKLYFGSGLAKWHSPIGDWIDGSAMSYYYETAPLPTALAWSMHHLPTWFHRVESWATLLLELVLPWFAFGSRPFRLLAFGAFTAFQLLNASTANYGFFVYLSCTLHLFLLDDADVSRVLTRFRQVSQDTRGVARALRAISAAWGAVYLALSGFELATSQRVISDPGDRVMALRLAYLPFRIINTYALFTSVTQARIEPEVEIEVAGRYRELYLRHKPGDPRSVPHVVAPHQPRVDFRLWFYGLNPGGPMPVYGHRMLERLCQDPAAVASLFRAPVPAAITHARFSFYEYRFTSAEERARSGAFWHRERLGATQAIPCGISAGPSR